MKAEKEKFLEYCRLYKNELADLQRDLDNDNVNDYCCTLAYLGLNYSYELANIGFELDYSGWSFLLNSSFDEIKENFLNTIMENEKIEHIRTMAELEKIEKRIRKAHKNKEEER